jgi:hypothetical protein
MAKLTDIRIESSPIGLELRLDWDNDWHQAIPLEALDPEHISLALMEAARAMIRRKLPNDPSESPYIFGTSMKEQKTTP